MARTYTDEEVLAVLPYARGDDREVLIGHLGSRVGTLREDDVVEELRRLYATEKGHARLAALTALCRRLGEAGTPYAIEALRSTYWGLQSIGSGLLADYGSRDAAAALFTWFERKLNAKNRPDDWDPYHLMTVIRFGVRHDLYLDVARLLVKYWDRLSAEEIEWLDRYWPSLVAQAGNPDVDIASPVRVGTYIFDELSPPQTPEERAAAQAEIYTIEDESLAAAYRRAHRRLEQERAAQR